jgi:deazaflavin-dependent oxidoreductase (nitroreductase family)
MTFKEALRAINKRVFNPAMMRLAGRKYWYAAVIRHIGRRSGREYATPVYADRLVDGFVIPLGYGTHVDWLRNVLSANRATIVLRGRTYHVVEPEVVDAASVLPAIPAKRRRVFQVMGIEQFVRLAIAA